MKKWTDAELVTLEINATAYGQNMMAKERNANKNPNNGAGGREDNTDPIIPSNDDSNKDPETQDSGF